MFLMFKICNVEYYHFKSNERSWVYIRQIITLIAPSSSGVCICVCVPICKTLLVSLSSHHLKQSLPVLTCVICVICVICVSISIDVTLCRFDCQYKSLCQCVFSPYLYLPYISIPVSESLSPVCLSFCQFVCLFVDLFLFVYLICVMICMGLFLSTSIFWSKFQSYHWL